MIILRITREYANIILNLFVNFVLCKASKEVRNSRMK